jgi:hypothetical protein
MLTWTLNGVTFADGGMATGSFQWDADGYDAALAANESWYTGGAYGD